MFGLSQFFKYYVALSTFEHSVHKSGQKLLEGICLGLELLISRIYVCSSLEEEDIFFFPKMCQFVLPSTVGIPPPFFVKNFSSGVLQ